jgi:hypothetical protein
VILSIETTDDGIDAVFFTRQNSVVSYFTDDGEGGVVPHAQLSEFACPWSTTPDKLEAVKMHMLAETARRLNCRVEEVTGKPFAEICKVADPHLKVRHTWTGPAKRRSRTSR